MRVLIIGCGYVGLPLGAELARQGHDVFGVRRTSDTAELSAAGIQPVVGDITQPGFLALLPPDFDWVVNTVSSSRGGVEDYRTVYLEGTRRLIDWLRRGSRLTRYIHASSTSVYGQTDGGIVTEDSPAEPATPTGRVLVQTERLLLEAARQGWPAVMLRLAGIYGPGRGHLFQQLLRGEARLAGEGSRILNMIHRDDAVRAVICALERGLPGEIYNVADDEPVTEREFFGWLCEQLGLPFPTPATPAELAGRKRDFTSKRVSNRKLRLALACELKYPTFRQGYAAEIAGWQERGQPPGASGL